LVRNTNDFTERFITFANDFDPNSQSQTNQHQAVAVKIAIVTLRAAQQTPFNYLVGQDNWIPAGLF
jgi:hypothetical protein